MSPNPKQVLDCARRLALCLLALVSGLPLCLCCPLWLCCLLALARACAVHTGKEAGPGAGGLAQALAQLLLNMKLESKSGGSCPVPCTSALVRSDRVVITLARVRLTQGLALCLFRLLPRPDPKAGVRSARCFV
jgi:hypothetical protein